MSLPRWPLFGWFALLTLQACDRGSVDATQNDASVAPAPARSVGRRPTQPPLSGEQVEIPGGAFLAGSVPGENGRHPELEPRRFEVELGPFQIDRLPYPNDPKAKPLTSVDRQEARRLCAERGARLCTELEWERACKGPASDAFISGAAWHQPCAKQPNDCASGFDVLGMGAALREWVSSDIIADQNKRERAVVRGASAAEPAHAHRCARRRGVDPEFKSDDLGFRCCKGAPNAAVVPEPKLETTFEKTSLPAAELEKLLAAHPKTKDLAKDIKYFREPDAARTVLQRGPGDDQGFSFTVVPLLWHPVAGTEYLLVAARSGEDKSFVVAFYVLGKNEYRLASSFVMEGEPGPVAFAYSGYIRPRLHFSTCWGCPGESGKILYREPDSVIILQP